MRLTLQRAIVIAGVFACVPTWADVPRDGSHDFDFARGTWHTHITRVLDPFAGGTISPHTMDLLIDAGYGYFGNGLADDIPHYWVTDAGSGRSILTMPYYYHYDDQFFLLFPSFVHFFINTFGQAKTKAKAITLPQFINLIFGIYFNDFYYNQNACPLFEIKYN